jgi:hypothetical protein
MQAEGHTRLDGGGKPRKLKFQIQQELGVKPETTKGAKGSNYAPGLTEWLVSTLLSVSARKECSDGIFERTNGVHLRVSFGMKQRRYKSKRLPEADLAEAEGQRQQPIPQVQYDPAAERSNENLFSSHMQLLIFVNSAYTLCNRSRRCGTA